jgi:hypothetical protein
LLWCTQGALHVARSVHNISDTHATGSAGARGKAALIRTWVDWITQIAAHAVDATLNLVLITTNCDDLTVGGGAYGTSRRAGVYSRSSSGRGCRSARPCGGFQPGTPDIAVPVRCTDTALQIARAVGQVGYSLASSRSRASLDTLLIGVGRGCTHVKVEKVDVARDDKGSSWRIEGHAIACRAGERNGRW